MEDSLENDKVVKNPPAPKAPTLKEIVREVPVFKEFDATIQLQVAEAMISAYRKGWGECLEFMNKVREQNTPKPKKGIFDN